MNKRFVRKFFIEVLALLLLSFLVVITGYLVSSDREDLRNQKALIKQFSSVLKSSGFEKINSDILNNHKDISNVYLGFNENRSPIGYVLDVNKTDSDGMELHLLVGIDYESANIVGIQHIKDEKNPISMDDKQFKAILNHLKGNRIPVSISAEHKEEKKEDDDRIIIGNLKDGTYYAQMLYKDANDYIDYVEIEVESGRIVRVKWDAVNLDPTTQNRAKASLSGAYSIPGIDWATQSYNLCHALIERQEPSKLAMKSDGRTQTVEGVTCDISLFVKLAEECIYYSQIGYDKDRYMAGMDKIFYHLFKSDAETKGLKNDDGVIVYSFDQNSSLYEVSDENGTTGKTLNVYQIESHFGKEDDGNEKTSEISPIPTESAGQLPDTVDGAEDGVVDSDDPMDSALSESIDSIPASEIMTTISPIEGSMPQTRLTVSCINTCYKFLKEYLNWLV